MVSQPRIGASKKKAETPAKGLSITSRTPPKKTAARKSATGKPTAAKKTAKKQTPTTKTTAKKASNSKKDKDHPSSITDGLELIPQGDMIAATGEQDAAILAVSFSEAMKITALLEGVGRQEQFKLSRHLANHSGDLLSKALTDARFVVERGEVIVKFSDKGTKLMKAGVLKLMPRKGGPPVPALISKSGKLVEQGKVVIGPLSKGGRIVANLTVATVTVAHIISGADLAKKMNNLDSKAEFLVAAHRIGQVARIEGVFLQARELISMRLTDTTRLELHRLGRELFEVRSAWRREISYLLGNLKKSEESSNWLVSRFQGLTRKGKDKNRAETVAARDSEIQLINGCIAIHLALAQAAGTLETFLSVSLSSEVEELRLIRDQLQLKRHDILKEHTELRQSIDDTCLQLTQIITLYEGMIIPRMPIEQSNRNPTDEPATLDRICEERESAAPKKRARRPRSASK